MKRCLVLIVAPLLAFRGAILADLDEPSAPRSSEHLQSFHSIRNLLPGGPPDGLPEKCGLRIITYALTSQDRMDPGIQQSARVLLSRPTTQKSVLIGNFRIHFDTTGVNEAALLDAGKQRIPGSANAFADSAGMILAVVSSAEIGGLGYPSAPLDGNEGGGPEYDVYVLDLGNMYGYTTPETRLSSKPEGAIYTTFMTIDNDFSFVSPDSNKGIPGMRVTLAHEFHHAIQLGNYGYWTDDVYYYEMTSTWMEDVVFPQVNDYLQYLQTSQSQFKSPDLPFIAVNGTVEYSRGVWCHYLARKYGIDCIRRTWEEIRNGRPLEAIDIALQAQPYFSTFRTAFAEWALWNYYTGSRSDTSRYYPEGHRYPLVAQTAVDFNSQSRDIAGTLGALASRYYQVMKSGDPLTLALANINLPAAKSSTQFSYTYRLSVNRIDDSYRATAAGVYVKLDVADPTNWYNWDIVRGSATPQSLTAGEPFPNPFHPDGIHSVRIPLNADRPVTGTLSIFSSSMDLVYSSGISSGAQLGKQVIAWKGQSSTDELVRSGVYFFALEVNGQVITGKLTVIRK